MIVKNAEPRDVEKLLTFRQEAAAWLSELGSDQWQRPYPADRLLKTIAAGTVFMVTDGDATAATITLTTEAEDGLWNSRELDEPSMFVNKLTVARTHAGRDLGGRLLDWAGERADRAGAIWLRLDAWTTNEALQRYYLRHGFRHVRTVLEGGGSKRWTTCFRLARSAPYLPRSARSHGPDGSPPLRRRRLTGSTAPSRCGGFLGHRKAQLSVGINAGYRSYYDSTSVSMKQALISVVRKTPGGRPFRCQI